MNPSEAQSTTPIELPTTQLTPAQKRFNMACVGFCALTIGIALGVFALLASAILGLFDRPAKPDNWDPGGTELAVTWQAIPGEYWSAPDGLLPVDGQFVVLGERTLRLSDADLQDAIIVNGIDGPNANGVWLANGELSIVRIDKDATRLSYQQLDWQSERLVDQLEIPLTAMPAPLRGLLLQTFREPKPLSPWFEVYDRQFIAQVVPQSSAQVNQGQGILRIGELSDGMDEIHWHHWIALPEPASSPYVTADPPVVVVSHDEQELLIGLRLGSYGTSDIEHRRAITRIPIPDTMRPAPQGSD